MLESSLVSNAGLTLRVVVRRLSGPLVLHTNIETQENTRARVTGSVAGALIILTPTMLLCNLCRTRCSVGRLQMLLRYL